MGSCTKDHTSPCTTPPRAETEGTSAGGAVRRPSTPTLPARTPRSTFRNSRCTPTCSHALGQLLAGREDDALSGSISGGSQQDLRARHVEHAAAAARRRAGRMYRLLAKPRARALMQRRPHAAARIQPGAEQAGARGAVRRAGGRAAPRGRRRRAAAPESRTRTSAARA